MTINKEEMTKIVNNIKSDYPIEKLTNLPPIFCDNKSSLELLVNWTRIIMGSKTEFEIMSNIMSQILITMQLSYERGYEKGQEDAFRTMIKGE